MATLLRPKDAIYSHADFDKGRVAKFSSRKSLEARVDLYLANIFGASRHKTHLYRRAPERIAPWRITIDSPSQQQGFHYRITKHAIRGCFNEDDRGHYYWMVTSTRRYRPDRSFYYLGNDDERLVAVSMNGNLVHKVDLRFIVPEAGAPTGYEELNHNPEPIHYDD